MFGNGVGIGIIAIIIRIALVIIRQELVERDTVLFGAGRGATSPSAAGLRIAPTATPITGTPPTTAFVLQGAN